MPGKTLIAIPILICTLLASMVFAVAVGPTTIPLETLFTSPTSQMIVWDVRIPRVITTVLVGCALAMAGTAMQGLFKNSMADPYIIGTSSGAGLGAALAIVFFAGAGLPILAFAGATIATFTVYTIARKGGKVPVETLLLAGVALSMLFPAFPLVSHVYCRKSLHQIMFWLMERVLERLVERRVHRHPDPDRLRGHVHLCTRREYRLARRRGCNPSRRERGVC